MPYVIRKTDGSVQLILQDGIVDRSTGLNLVGRSFIGYGDLIAENFVRLLENFANDTPPSNPLPGQIWFDKSINDFKFYLNNQWELLSRVGPEGPVGPIGPEGPQGLQGIEGPSGPSGPVPNWSHTGSYDSTVIYQQGDLVTYDGELFYRIGFDNNLTGYAPGDPTLDNDPAGYWRLVATKGLQGDIGYTGSQGPTGPIPIWIHTGEYDATRSYSLGELVTYQGELYHRTDYDNSAVGKTPGAPASSQYWQLVATRGVEGPIGYTGSRGVGFTGSQGITGYDGSRGSPGFPGVKGDKGDQGDQGYTGSQGITGYTGSTGDLTFAGQAITGTVSNEDIVLSPLGQANVAVNSDLIPGANNFYNVGTASAKWQRVHANTIEAEAFRGATPPTSSVGVAGDYRGKIAFNSQYFYYCAANYNGVTSIWKRVAWSSDNW